MATSFPRVGPYCKYISPVLIQLQQAPWCSPIYGEKRIILHLLFSTDVNRAMTHDEERYPRPNEFIPERFLNERGGLNDDNTILAYGFGRR
jgi:hypothetical protein